MKRLYYTIHDTFIYMIHLYTWCKSINNNNNNNKLSIWKKTKYLTICNTWSKNNLALFCCYSSYTELPPSPFSQLQNSWKPVVSGSSRFPLVLSREGNQNQQIKSRWVRALLPRSLFPKEKNIHEELSGLFLYTGNPSLYVERATSCLLLSAYAWPSSKIVQGPQNKPKTLNLCKNFHEIQLNVRIAQAIIRQVNLYVRFFPKQKHVLKRVENSAETASCELPPANTYNCWFEDDILTQKWNININFLWVN